MTPTKNTITQKCTVAPQGHNFWYFMFLHTSYSYTLCCLTLAKIQTNYGGGGGHICPGLKTNKVVDYYIIIIICFI